MEEPKVLSASMELIKVQLALMRRCLDNDQLMDALKSASTMLGELRTSVLSPKQYYELYMAVFDALRHLSVYLYDAHTSGRNHLADLYELVQYAGNIVPRLYLMITVGTVYMSIKDAPTKEIMKDMMEMTRGVQHPTRGLFLRHYLSGMTRDHLPIGDDPGPGGNVQDSIGFILTNFIEMNKLWVRLQHQGLSRDREKREIERKELRILVGTNLVRLSQLDGVDLETYRKVILPSVLEQVVNCKDVIAQEYLMEVVIQVFTDEFHLFTLTPFLSATAHLHPKVNIKAIVIALIDRLAAYAARESENESPEERKRKEEAAGKRLLEKVRTRAVSPDSGSWEKAAHGSNDGSTDGQKANGGSEEKKVDEKKEPVDEKADRFRGIPENVRLFEIFWFQVTELIKNRPDLSIQDITALLVSITNLALSCYPDRLEYVDQVLAFARRKMSEYSDSPDLHHPITIGNSLSLLLAPVHSYASALTLLALPSYLPLLSLQPYTSRKSVSHAIISSILKNETPIDTVEDVKGILEICHVLIKDQRDAAVGMGMAPPGREEQGWVARMVHLFKADDLETQFELLQTARREFQQGGDRIRWTFPPLVIEAIRLARRYKYREETIDDFLGKINGLFRWIHATTSILYNKVESSEICLRLYVMAMQTADETEQEELAYQFAVEAFTIYEESISESRAQLQAITFLIGAIQATSVFGNDNYDTLITKAALHGSKLLKKGQQATAVGFASHLWWQTETLGRERDPDNDEEFFRDGKRVLECLQKVLRIATSSIDELTSIQLYCDALDQYLYYFEHQVETVSSRHINSLVELISSNIDSIASPSPENEISIQPSFQGGGATSGLVEGVNTIEATVAHFRNTLAYIASRKEALKHGSVANGEEIQRAFEEVEIEGVAERLPTDFSTLTNGTLNRT
ncbi:vacuolar protein sorting-associated protein 35 [Atractiella rhizophila]|nr:vacuolar protein sorting-associated protein 35 [Atractiella rhizophila]